MISSKSIRFQLLLSTAAAVSLALPCAAVAQNIPQGGVFVEGSGTIPPDLGQTTQNITLDTDRSVINWNSFDIGQNYTVNFTGPDAVAVLNRVVTVDVSNINGTLMSDPSIAVFLINPNGIIFGNGASVNVGSFIASTLDLDNDDFMAEGILNPDQTPPDTTLYYFFSGDVDTGITVEDGAQVGTSSGYLVLLGAYVRLQAGSSVSSAADVGLAAGNVIRVPANPGSPISFSTFAPTPVEDAITIGGIVSGQNVTVAMETEADAQNALLLVTDTGSITATSNGGDVILSIGARTTSEGEPASSPGGIRNDGALAASGSIVLSGRISSDSGTLFRPRFVENNGTINAGGDVFMLAYEDVTNAGTIMAGNDVTLSALASGTGTAPDFGLNVTNSGQITAGGDVALNAHAEFSDYSTGGTIILLAAGSSVSAADIALAPSLQIINSGTISAGGNVSIDAGIDLSSFSADNIDIAPSIQITNSGSITAVGDVNIDATISLSDFSADSIIATPSLEIINNGFITADGDVDIDARIDLSEFTATEIDVTAHLAVGNSGLISAGSDINIVAGIGISDFAASESAASDLALFASSVIANSGTIAAGGDVNIVAGISISSISAAFVTATVDQTINNSGLITAEGDINIIAGIDFSEFGASVLDATVDMAILNGGTMSAGGDVNVIASITSTSDLFAQNARIANGGMINAGGDGNLLVDGTITNSGLISVDGVVNLDAGDDIDNSGSIAAVGDAILTAGGDILDSSGSLAGSISGADVALAANGSITAGSVTARDDIAIRAPGTVTTRSLISGATIGSDGPVEVLGAADDLLEGTNLSGHDVDVDGIVIYAGVIRAIGTGSDIRLGAPVSPAISDLDFSAGGDISIDGPASGVDVAMDAGGTITAGDISARDDIALRAGTTLDVGLLQSGVPIGNLGPVDQAGSADALLGTTLTGHDLFIQASELSRDQATANGTNSDLIMRATTGDLSIDNGLAGGNVDLGAAQLVTVGTVVAQAGDVIILADDLDILGSISGSQVSITNRSGGKTVTVVGDASAAGAFTLTEAEINRINSDVLNIDSLDQNMLVGNIAFDNDVGSTRIGLLGTARIDVIGEVDASGVTRTLQIGGTAGTGDPNDASTLASIIRIAPMSSGGGRIILGGGSLDLRGVKIGVGLDDGFLQQLGLVAGGTPASNEVVQDDWIGNLNSTLYGIPGGYADPIVISAGSITVTYTDYALFQNTGTISSPSGVNADQLSIVSSGNDGNSFELFGTIDEVEGRGAALLVEPTDVSLATSRVNGCLIVTGGGCGSGSPTDNSRDPADFNPTAPPEPPNGEFSSSALGGAGGEFAEQELVSTDDDQAFEFDSLVGTNNEGLLGVLGVDDADAPEQCAPDDKRPLCRNEEKPDAQ